MSRGFCSSANEVQHHSLSLKLTPAFGPWGNWKDLEKKSPRRHRPRSNRDSNAVTLYEPVNELLKTLFNYQHPWTLRPYINVNHLLVLIELPRDFLSFFLFPGHWNLTASDLKQNSVLQQQLSTPSYFNTHDQTQHWQHLHRRLHHRDE